MNFITREILLIIFNLANPKFSCTKSSQAESKAKHKSFRFFYFYGVPTDFCTNTELLTLQKTFRKMYPNIHCNITRNTNGLTVWVSDNLLYDSLITVQ
jgi:hypothetical protein